MICLGAAETHMGRLSELGPIDPQVDGLPALGLSDGVHFLTDLAARRPEASEMLARFLSMQLRVEVLGYMERVSESATQYTKDSWGP